MDFLPVYKGVLNIMVLLGLAAGSTLSSPQIPPSDLKTPGIIEAYNISAEHYDVEPPPLVVVGETVIEENSEVEELEKIILVPSPSPEQSIDPEVVTGPILPQTVIRPEPKVAKVEIVEEAEASDSVKIKTTVSPSPSSTVAASATPSPTPTPTPAASNVSLSGNSQRMFDMVNEYRKGKGLAAFEKDSRLCEIAEKRAPQVNGELANGTLHKGFKDLNLPYWSTENIVAYSTLEQNLKFWLSDYIHKKAIESDHKYSCTSCSGTSCSQIFTSFVPK